MINKRNNKRKEPYIMNFMSISKKLTAVIAGAGMLVGLAACGSDPTASGSSSRDSDSASEQIVVGSANFAESQILGEIYVQALNDNGIKASSKPNIGSREIYVRALQDGSINLIADYTGNLLQYFDPQATQSESAEVYEALKEKTPKDLTVLAQSEAEDADNIVVSRDFSQQYGVTSLADLKDAASKVSDGLTITAPPEFGKRAYGIPGLKNVYDVDVKLVPVSDEGGQTTVNAVKDGATSMAKLTTTSPFLSDGSLVVLEDPEHLIAAQNVVPLAAASLKNNDKAVTVINEVQEKLTTDDLVKMNGESVNNKKTPEQIATEWLKENPIQV